MRWKNKRLGVQLERGYRMVAQKSNEDSLPNEEKLRIWVQKKKNNDEKVPKELLKTKYKKAYEELKDKIKVVADTLIIEKLAEGIVIQNDGAGIRIMEQIQELIKQKKNMGIGKKLGKALMEEYSVDKYLQIVENLRIQILNLWIPYWQEHCCFYISEHLQENEPLPRIYNELTRKFLIDDEKNIWEEHSEWETENRIIITAGACRLLTKKLKNKEEYNG